MHPVVLPIYRRCNQACRFCAVHDQLDGAPVDPRGLREAIDAAKRAGADTVCLTGGEATLAPALIQALAYAHGIGLRTALTTNGRLLADVEKVGRLVAVGLDAVHLSLHAVTPAIHVDLVGGDPVSHAQTVAALHHCAPRFETTVRTVVTTANLGEIEGLVALCAEVGARFELRGVQREGAADAAIDPGPDATIGAWRRAWAACQDAGVPFSWWGLRGVTPAELTQVGPPVPLDPARRVQLQTGLVDRALLGGLLGGADTARDLGELWGVSPRAAARVAHARGAAIADLPAPEPLPWTRPERVRIIVDAAVPALAGRHALPALAEALRAHGVHADVRAWSDRLPRESSLRRWLGLRREADATERAGMAEADAALWASLDLDGVDLAVVWGARAAERVRAHRSAPAGLRTWIVDAGDDQPVALGPADVWWSPYPSTARGLALSGVPLRQVVWGPVPTPPAEVIGAREGEDWVVVAGGPRVDGALVRAAWPEPSTLKLVAWPGTRVASVPTLPDTLDDRLEALRRARWVWLPVTPGGGLDPELPALAEALGIPRLVTPRPRVTDGLRPLGGRVAEATGDAQREALLADPPTPRPASTLDRWVRALLDGPSSVAPPHEAGTPWWPW